MNCSVVRELDRLEDFLKSQGQLNCAVIQGLDLRDADVDWHSLDFAGAVFLGCHFPEGVSVEFLVKGGAAVFPKFPLLPYDPYRSQLYSREELMEGWSPVEDKSLDKRIYDHFVQRGRSSLDVFESLAQRLHDHAVDDALTDLLEGRVDGGEAKKVVAIMGGHSTLRTDPYFEEVVKLTRELTREGYFIASGGGPGIMEAANLGAYLVNEPDEIVEWVLNTLKMAPSYEDEGYVGRAMDVLERIPKGGESVAIPTWFYGHEPTNAFSNQVAKYFSNSLREDGLLAIAIHGVVYAPGSAGTVQEVFMDACQNHYGTFHWISPMVFLGCERWGGESRIFDAVEYLAQGKPYRKSLALVDTAEEAAKFLKENPPFKAAD